MIAGIAGDGVLFTGNVLAKILKMSGWEIVTYRDFPSNIRGEETSYTIRASLEEIHGRSDKVDVLIAFDCKSIFKHLDKISERGLIICDGEDLAGVPGGGDRAITHYVLLLRKLARDYFRSELYKNMIVLGVLCFILDLDSTKVKKVVSEIFLKTKGKEAVEKNCQALNIGYNEAARIVDSKERHSLEVREDRERLLISGDEAIALGALAAGCRFFAAYPICPASEIWQYLALHMGKFNGLVVQVEDELAALNMVLGASFAGVRSMTSTSGPGASLMMEAFGLSGMAEIPAVIAHVQRVGPSTGMPTKTEQGDLLQWVFGSHGDFPRIVLSPGNVEECFELTWRAFNLAEKYQCPVVILTEQDYGQNLRTVKKIELSEVKIDRGKLLRRKKLGGFKEFRRYAFTSDGVSPRSVPSQPGGIYVAEGNEHDEWGYRNEDAENRKRMMEKRMLKLKSALKDLIPARIWGKKDSSLGIISFGSNFGAIREAMKQLEEKGIHTRFLQLRTIWPLQIDEVMDFVNSCHKLFVVENNYSGQLSTLLRSQIRAEVEIFDINKYSSDSFTPPEISLPIEREV
ncbi:MAG: 2-oxoacid:acceptor oxidoreductase subunit alpha [Candidatus Aminicenantales bacterium]